VCRKNPVFPSFKFWKEESDVKKRRRYKSTFPGGISTFAKETQRAEGNALSYRNLRGKGEVSKNPLEENDFWKGKTVILEKNMEGEREVPQRQHNTKTRIALLRFKGEAQLHVREKNRKRKKGGKRLRQLVQINQRGRRVMWVGPLIATSISFERRRSLHPSKKKRKDILGGRRV